MFKPYLSPRRNVRKFHLKREGGDMLVKLIMRILTLGDTVCRGDEDIQQRDFWG